jgi:acetylornithine deacetylase/succinyl-diaminopimelate desuccinylase-like protein
MGAIRERDGAITKLAHMVRALVLSKAKLQAAGGQFQINLGQGPNLANESLVLEGGQGFIPTHGIQEVMSRMRKAAKRGAESYLRLTGNSESGEQFVKVAFEKLHNVAFDGDVNSFSVKNAIAAARASGIWKDEPVLGWTVSCDARLFATEYPQLEVLTFGPGLLAHAHSDKEQVKLKDIRAAVEFLAVFLMRQTATLI